MKKLFKLFLILVIVSLYFLPSVKFKHEIPPISHDAKVAIGPNYNIFVIQKDQMTFGVSDEKPVDSDFYTNSNFFTNDAPIGLVVVDGKKLNSKVTGGGYFYVKNGEPHVSAKRCPKNVDYASQTILWAIDNGVVNESLLNENHAKLKRYRTIMGEDNDGNIIVISSDRVGLVTIAEIVEFGKSKGITEGILLDGGTSVDYKFSDDSKSVSFQSVPENLKPMLEIKTPTTYIYGNFN